MTYRNLVFWECKTLTAPLFSTLAALQTTGTKCITFFQINLGKLQRDDL